jgi:hypothetical protein
MKRNTLKVIGSSLALAGSMLSTAAFAETPKLSHTASGYEVRWKNGCLAQYNSKGQAMYFTPECDDKQIAQSESTVASYISSQKSTGASGSGNKNATLTKKGDGTFEVVWKTDCIADFNKRGEATFLASTCDDNEIEASTKMVKDYIKKN